MLVAALLSRRGAPARLLERWLAGDFELVVSNALLREVERVLAYPKIRRRVAAADARAFVKLLRDMGAMGPDSSEPPPVRSPDPGDDYLVALAAQERTPLVTGDGDLLDLADGAPVLTPRAFLDALDPR